jgi:hypothetical protein
MDGNHAAKTPAFLASHGLRFMNLPLFSVNFSLCSYLPHPPCPGNYLLIYNDKNTEHLQTDAKVKRLGAFSTKILLFTASFCCLLAGALIYCLCRDSGLLVFDITGRPAFWGRLRLIYPGSGLPAGILAYNIPDGLWLLSGLWCLRALWLDNEPKGAMYTRIFFVLALLFEGLQRFDRIQGTFDSGDLITYTIAAFIEVVFYSSFIRRKN